MPVTLAQAALNAQTDLDLAVIDEFRTNPILDTITFDDAVNPAGGGGTLTYGYRRQITAATAAFRAVNSEYTPQEVTTAQYTVDLKPLGGAFQVDRILRNVGPAASGAISVNLNAKIKAAKSLFGSAVINGDSAVDANSFDGLSKALAGSSTEITTAYDVTGVHDTPWAFKVLELVDDLLSNLDGEATALVSNKKFLNLFRAAARMTSQYTREPGPRNSYLERYGAGGPILVDAGFVVGSGAEVIPVDGVAGTTAVYAYRAGMDGFHGVSTMGGQLVSTYLPDWNQPGAVKTGEVELGPVGVALKATRAASVLRSVKVQ